MNKVVSIVLICLTSFLGFSQDQTVVGKKIKSIVVEVIGEPDLVPREGLMFSLMFTTTLENGEVIIGNSPDGNTQDWFDYYIEIDGAKTFGSKGAVNYGKIKSQWSCRACEDDSDNVLTINVKRKEDADWLTTQTIDIICK